MVATTLTKTKSRGKEELEALELAYIACERLAKTHYENFPVASILLPKLLRRPITVIYAFARTADDIADEGELSQSERLSQLAAFEENLKTMRLDSSSPDKSLQSFPNNAIQSNPNQNNANFIFIALQDVLSKHHLPIKLFSDLLQAFKQDVTKHSYQNYSEVLNYCQNSANPVGRLLLHLTKNDSEENLLASDAICTALQLINFIQDLHEDATVRQRSYLPKDEMGGITLEDLKIKHQTEALQTLIQQQLVRILKLLDQGRPLGKRLKGFFGFEIRLIITCAYFMVLQLIKRNDVFKRPTIKFRHWWILVLKSLFL